MKCLFILLSLVFVDNRCSESKIDQEAISFEYSAQSRAFYKNIKINKKNVFVGDKRDTTPTSKTCSEAHWNMLLEALKLINVENISTLKAPSEDRFFDGAAIARLKVIYNGTTYETQAFDHGNPPEEIKGLVKEILSISENIE
ncbi:hypothetical protein Q4Q34_05755 [Flavivirga abyssicola]|uniref:hypothetical protein n=1 Tax=Flavivirga abyssicola TaxID=3063533 RepID=UPI0026E0CE1D|nr:hypothetical protein [Flavivirga sp. MEBiC07777]WVK14533.1 hypothetical protein Q4Q34_05755 [Flavivirga sp. MEBiC07777]